MLVKEWMSENPVVLDQNASIMKAIQIMKEYGVRRIPIVQQDKLVGIVTDRDIREATPSKATTLDVHELYYLLSEIKVKDIMTPDPITIQPEETVEFAAVIMLENRISGLPVVDDNKRVIGIITQTDIFKVLINITGIYYGPYQLVFDLENRPGSIREVLDVIREHNGKVISFLTSYIGVEPEIRRVYFRLAEMDSKSFEELLASVKAKFNLLYWVKDDLSELPKKELPSSNPKQIISLLEI